MDIGLAMMAVIGSLLKWPDKTGSAFLKLTPDCFTDEQLRRIFETCRQKSRDGKPWDAAILTAELGDEYLSPIGFCQQAAVTIHNFDSYVEILRENWRKARMCGELMGLVEDCQTPATGVRDIMSGLSRILEEQSEIQRTIDNETAKDFAAAMAEFLVSLHEPDTGVRTGWGILIT